MNLKQLRKNKKLTQVQAAELCGLSRKGYQNLEEGKNKKKNSPTLLYCLTRLEEYGVNRTISERELKRELDPRYPFWGCSFLYACGGFSKSLNPEGPLILFGDYKLSQPDLREYEDELTEALGKEVQLSDFNSQTQEGLIEVLAHGIRLYPKKDEH